MYVQVTLTLQNFSLLTLEGMVMYLHFVPTPPVDMNGVHDDNFFPPRPTFVESNEQFDDLLSPPSTAAVESSGIDVDLFLLRPHPLLQIRMEC